MNIRILGIVFLFFIVSCGSNKKNNNVSEGPDSKSDAQISAPINVNKNKQTIENIRISVLLHQSEFNRCYKNYLAKYKEENRSKGWLVVRWKIYDDVARDVSLIKSYHKYLDQCFLNTVKNIGFDDVYNSSTISTVTFPFLISSSGVDLNRNIDLR